MTGTSLVQKWEGREEDIQVHSASISAEYLPAGTLAALCIQGLEEKWALQNNIAVSPNSYSSWSKRRTFVSTKLLGIRFCTD